MAVTLHPLLSGKPTQETAKILANSDLVPEVNKHHRIRINLLHFASFARYVPGLATMRGRSTRWHSCAPAASPRRCGRTRD